MRESPAQPLSGVVLCALDDLADPGAKSFVFREGDRLFMGFVVRRGGQAFGYIDRCPHAGLPLATFGDRFLTREGDLILCSSHGALFKLDTGLCIGGPCAGRSLWPWPVTVEAGMIVVAQ